MMMIESERAVHAPGFFILAFCAREKQSSIATTTTTTTMLREMASQTRVIINFFTRLSAFLRRALVVYASCLTRDLVLLKDALSFSLR